MERDYAKRLAYGLLYGMGPARLAKDLRTTIADAEEKGASFLKAMNGLAQWMQELRVSALKDQHITVSVLDIH